MSKPTQVPTEEIVIVVCGHTNEIGIPGKKDVCSVCAAEVFLSDSTLRSCELNRVEKKEIRIHCLGCALPKLKMLEKEKFIPPTEEQKQEILLSRLGGNKNG